MNDDDKMDERADRETRALALAMFKPIEEKIKAWETEDYPFPRIMATVMCAVAVVAGDMISLGVHNSKDQDAAAKHQYEILEKTIKGIVEQNKKTLGKVGKEIEAPDFNAIFKGIAP